MLLSIFLSLFLVKLCYGFVSDVTSEVFGEFNQGVVAAFGDFNADKLTDIFVINSTGVNLLQAQQHLTKNKVSFLYKPLLINLNSSKTVFTSVAPGDFDGDAQMDLLVTAKTLEENSNTTIVQIYWGNSSKNSLDPIFLELNESLKDQPSVIDANGDMIPDLVGETEDGARVYFLFNENRSYTVKIIKNGTESALDPLRIPQSSAYFDFYSDLVPDLCMVSEKDEQLQFEIWTNQDGNLAWNKTIVSPPQLKKFGRASFYDLNDNQEINIILPGCSDENCSESNLFVWGRGQWHQLNIDFKSWQFYFSNKAISWLDVPFTLRIGDFNLDGFPDAIAVLKAVGNESYGAFLMINVPCSTCEGFSRTFEINFETVLSSSSQPLLGAFYDFMENGILDVILTELKDSRLVIRALEQDFTADAYFLKVMVTSGLCVNNCPNGHQPYGVNQVGPVVKFQTTTSTGDSEIGICSQLSQSAYYSLQLPFGVFGLGQTPNFVDFLEVGIQNPPSSEKRLKSWPSIIPNSQVVVIPHPTNSPSSWITKLYVTPSRLVLLTGTSLLGTCAFIAIVIILLHWRERVEDKKEKLQEAQRFHFDAM